MKVILLRDVAKIGRRYEVVEVPDGFALNKLIPKGDAQQATADNIKRVTNMREKDKSNKALELGDLKAIAQSLNETPLVIAMQANAQGHLFKAVHAADVVAAAKGRGVTVHDAYVAISEPIKSLGEHTIALTAQGQSFPFIINVEAK
jgi:large subunit ribosomal protein L9